MYENIFTQYDKTIAGQKIKSLLSVEIGLDAPTPVAGGKYGTVTGTIDANVTATLTGRYLVFSTGGKAYQINYGTGWGYIFSENLGQWAKVTTTTSSYLAAENKLKDIIQYHQSILEKNLLCARGLELLSETGALVPIEFKQGVFDLQQNLINRNSELKKSGYLQNIQEAEHPTLNKYNQALVNFMNNPGIGFVISTTVFIIVSGIIAVASAAIAYTVFKSMHISAKADFRFSNSLTADLIKYLPKDVYDKLMAENAANAKAAQDAIDKAKGGGIMQAVKTGGLILLGVWIADKFIFNNRSSSNN